MQAQIFAQADRIEERFSAPTIPRRRLPSVPESPFGTTPIPDNDASFSLAAVEINGATVYPPGTFDALFASKLGTVVTVAELFEVADTISARYRRDGFLLSHAVVPEQRIADGHVVIEVIEGFVDNVLIQGDGRSLGENRLLAFGERIKAERPLTATTLERYLLLADDLPGHTVQAVFEASPSGRRGAANLTMVVENELLVPFFHVNNRGSESIGPYHGEVGLNAYSLLGLGERLTVRGGGTVDSDGRTDELHFMNAEIEVPIDNEGSRVISFFTYSEISPTLPFVGFVSDGTSIHTGLRFTHPVVRNRRLNLDLEAGFDARFTKSKTTLLPTSRDKLYVLRAGGTIDDTDSFFGITRVDLFLHQGIGGGGTRAESRRDANPAFTKLTGEVRRVQHLVRSVDLELALSGQWTPDKLPAAEEIGFGGVVYGRAYDPSEFVGDTGLRARGEIRYELPFADLGLGRLSLDYVRLLGFGDWGSIYNFDDSEQRGAVSAGSLGFGIRFGIGGAITATLEVAKPLGEATRATGDRDPRFFFNVGGRF